MDTTRLIERFSTPDEAGLTLMTPLVVSQAKKVLYLHIAKTGGSSIVRLLKNNGMDDGVLSHKGNDVDHAQKLAYFTEVANNWDDYYKFTFVRNKYDLLISLYNYDSQLHGAYSLPSSTTFENFIVNHVGCSDTFVKKIQYNKLIDQYYLTHLDGEPLFDFVGEYQTYTADLNKVCDHLGVVNTQVRVNEGNYDRSKKDSYYTETLRENLRTKFPQEFEHFGW
jgi:hypothetical protein